MPETVAVLTLQIERVGSTATVRVHGKLVAGVGDLLYQPVSKLLPQYTRVVLDLSELTRMDSMGLGTLVRLYVSARSAGCSLELINLGKQIRLLLGTAHLLTAFKVAGEHGIRMG